MYGIDALIVNDTHPPIVRAISTEPFFDFLRIEARAADATTRALGATFIYSDRGAEVEVPLNFANPPSRGDSTHFFDLVGPLPSGTPLSHRIDFFDAVGNRSSSGPRSVLLDRPPAVPGLSCILHLEQTTIAVRFPRETTNSLLAKLNAAAGHAASGHPHQSIEQLEEYRHELRANRRRTEQEVRDLDHAAAACIAELRR